MSFLGPLIQAGTSLLGGFLNKKSQESAQEKAIYHEGKTYERNLADRYKHIARTKEAADASGIHLLSALGINDGYQPTGGPQILSSGSAMGDGIASAGAAIGDALQQRRNQKEAKKLKPMQDQLMQAQLEEMRSRTLLNQANAKRSLVGPASNVDPFAMRRENSLIEVKLEDGTIIRMPNPDLYETGPAELATGRAIIEAARAAHHLKGGNKTIHIDKVTAKDKVTRKELSAKGY